MIEIKGKFTTAKIFIDNVEEEAINQIYKFVNNSSFTEPVAIMPDTHAGKGSVVGFTMPLNEKIIPNVIGVDIGCGMMTRNIGKLNKKYKDVDKKVRNSIPMGINVHLEPKINFETQFPWQQANEKCLDFIRKYNKKFDTNYQPIKYSYEWLIEKCEQVGSNLDVVESSIGTLGGGNHFIEFGKDDREGDIWVTVHSGSRNFGKCVAEYHQKKAKKIIKKKKHGILQDKIKKIRAEVSDNKKIPQLIDKARQELGLYGNTNDLEYLEGQDAIDYFYDMIFVQTYADFNRKVMLSLINKALKNETVKDEIISTHNYIDFEDMIIRKGAITSYKGKREIIPFNMRDGLLIVEGKSNSEWNYSAPHGAGRVMSRSKAKETNNLDVFKKQMDAVYSTSVSKNTLDEAPNAYKDAKIIEDAIEPTSNILFRVKPVINMKDNSENISWKERRNMKKSKPKK